MKQLLKQTKTALFLLIVSCVAGWADDFTVERAINLNQLDSWADISQFQWQEIDHGIQDNHEEMDALINLFHDPAPKDTVGFYDQIYKARDNQYIVLRLDKAQGKHPFYIRVTCIRSTEDPSLNMSKLYTAKNYVYIMPPIGETQLEVKIWPQGEGEETAKAFTFNGHSYGSESVRTVMLDKSRIVPGDYDLQLIRYDDKTEKSDTAYIKSLQTDKLYTFYTYDKGDLMEAYLQVGGFKRIKLKTEWWARDAVTHVNDNSVMVMTGPKMPFLQHKRLDAPNPTYLDSRLFSHHDTLWVNLYLDNKPSDDIEGLTMHAVLADTENEPIGDKLLTWGKDPVSNRLYVLTDGEPCTIECYRNGFLPKLCLYPGSYDHKTGIISGESEEVDIYLESISAPITSPTVTSSILSTLTPTIDCRGNFYVSDIQQADILPMPLNETVSYDEYGSHKDTLKVAKGMMFMSYAQMEVAIVSPIGQSRGDITLKKVKNAEKNDILKETLDGDTRVIYSNLYDYSYWTTRFDLREYLDINTSGRPAVAFDGTVVRQLPILQNFYTDTEKMKKDVEESTKEQLGGRDASDKAKEWITEVNPGGGINLSVQIPFAPPFYSRIGFEVDFFKAKKVSVSAALGIGIFYDVIKGESSQDPGYSKAARVSTGSVDDYGSDVTSLSDLVNDKDDPYETVSMDFKASIYAEVYGKASFPISMITQKDRNFGQYLWGMQWIDEAGIRAEANVAAGCRLDLLDFAANMSTLYGSGDNWLTSIQGFLNGNKFTKALREFIGPSLSASAGARLNVTSGVFAFNNTTGTVNPLKNHILAFKFNGQAYLNLQAKAKVDAIVAGAEVGASAGAGISFKYAAGTRLDFEKDFSGSAYSWYAGIGLYYKVKFLGWSKYGSFDAGRLKVQQKLIKPKNFKNPFHKNFVYHLSDVDEPKKASSQSPLRKANASLPGNFVMDCVDFNQPVKFISGGDSIIYQGSYENPNDYCVEVASTGDPIYLSDWHLGGCTDYDAASIPGTDMVVLEQATATIAQEDLEDTLTLDETVKRASRVYSVYYTKKNAGTKWYSPKPVYSSTETTSYRPRVALADDGTGVAIWQEGLFDKGSWVTPEDTVQLTDLVMNGHLMMSRFDGNETWSAPIELMALDENCMLKDYRVTYDGSTAFIIARKVGNRTNSENICLTVDAAGNMTMHDVEQTDALMPVRRVGDQNVLAWINQPDSLSNSTAFHVKSYGMDGNAGQGINTSLILNNTNVEEFRIVPDLEAKSLKNVALLWRETKSVGDSTETRLMASRLVPQSDGSFSIGTPITTVQLKDNNTIYGFDGYMTNEKMQVCYVAVDSLGNSQLNKSTSYFGNAFGYTVEFDTDNNQGFQCDKDEITLLITVNNYGTSTINECVLTVDDKQYPLEMTIPAGAFAKERVVIPYILGTGVNTTLNVKYDDVLGIQEQSYPRFLARRASYGSNGIRKAEERNAENATYEQHTEMFYPYKPRLECFVAGQRVDKNGDNHITICVRNYSRRSLSGEFAYVVGLKEHSYSSIVYIGAGEGHIKYDTKMLFNNVADVKGDGSYMHDCGSYYAGYVTITVPGITEKTEMYVGATLVYKEPKTGWYMRLVPDTYSGSNNSGIVTLYPSPEVVSVEKVLDNNDEGAHMRVSLQSGNLVVTGAEPRQQVRLYQANGAIIARQQADGSGKVTFTAPWGNGVGLVSSGNETVKFIY